MHITHTHTHKRLGWVFSILGRKKTPSSMLVEHCGSGALCVYAVLGSIDL